MDSHTLKYELEMSSTAPKERKEQTVDNTAKRHIDLFGYLYQTLHLVPHIHVLQRNMSPRIYLSVFYNCLKLVIYFKGADQKQAALHQNIHLLEHAVKIQVMAIYSTEPC